MSLAEKTLQTLSEIKDQLRDQLRAPDRLQTPPGLPTGWAGLDQFLLWGGLPKGALSLLHAPLGMGATSLWLECAIQVLQNEKWAAWINGPVPLSPLSLYHRGTDFSRLVIVEDPEDSEKLFRTLQELMSASLFDLLGCDLGTHRLKEHQLRKLQAQARSSHVALVFFSQSQRSPQTSAFSLILNFTKKMVLVEKALHRPTPHPLTRSLSYARFTQHADHLQLDSHLNLEDRRLEDRDQS